MTYCWVNINSFIMLPPACGHAFCIEAERRQKEAREKKKREKEGEYSGIYLFKPKPEDEYFCCRFCYTEMRHTVWRYRQHLLRCPFIPAHMRKWWCAGFYIESSKPTALLRATTSSQKRFFCWNYLKVDLSIWFFVGRWDLCCAKIKFKKLWNDICSFTFCNKGGDKLFRQ